MKNFDIAIAKSGSWLDRKAVLNTDCPFNGSLDIWLISPEGASLQQSFNHLFVLIPQFSYKKTPITIEE